MNDITVSIDELTIRRIDAITASKFAAPITVFGPDDTRTVAGFVEGVVAFDADMVDLAEEGDCEDEHTYELGQVADQIKKWLPKQHDRCAPDRAVLVQRLRLRPEWRGHRLTGSIMSELLSLLQCPAEWSVVVLRPEPLDEDGHCRDAGPERDQALGKLCNAYTAAGFRRWKRTPFWWLDNEEHLSDAAAE